MEEKKTRTTKQMDLLSAIEQIVELANESQLSKEFYRKADKYIKYVSTKLELTKEQSVMMALFINRSDHNRILIRELSKDVNCPTIRILRYMNDIDELEKRGLVRCCRERRSLLAFKELDKHGYPPGFDDMREWNKTIQKMADAFELMKYVHTLSEDEGKTVTKGLDLFCKYFRNLWD